MGEDIFEKLNDKQREAVLETEGYVRVIAGAGSGKTKLLVSRYAYLVRDYGIDSANILCVTFTNKAAGEMKKRIRGLIGDEYDTTLICTYHGFCNRLLRENSEKLFLNKQFQIIDGYQQKAIMTEIYQKFELKLDYASFESILHKLGAFKSDPAYVPRICSPTPCQIMDKIETQDEEIMEEFLQRQKATYSLDFNDLIAFAIYVLENHEDVRTKWQERLNYIMVDEFQDSSSTEMKLIEILSEQYGNLMIVGDPDQNIYEWRGSDVKLLVDFDKDHVPTKTIFLNQNYRSTPEILKCANTLIEKNELRLKKDLFTQNPGGAAVRHYHSKDDFEEMDQVIDNIKKLSQKEGLRFSDFAILYRSGFLSRIAEKKLVERNIPYEIFGGVKFYQRMEILDVLAYLKLIAFDDDMSFKRIVNTPRRRFGRAKMSYLEQLRDGMSVEIEPTGQMSLFDADDDREVMGEVRGQRSLFATLKDCRENRELCNDDICRFIDFVEEIRQRLSTMRISEIVNTTTSQSGYEGYI
ncbi:MAG: UvrD-helicase domain-containing protein, partial [Lachnospiraceae bacterium]|nr:UvrD-helicase domain-containing protein [Lachnospiraceae bacterium]